MSGMSKTISLDENIARKSKTLAWLVGKKISRMITDSVPEASTVTVKWEEDLKRYTISKITAKRAVIHRFASDVEASGVIKEFEQIVKDVNHYIDLGGGRKLRKLNRQSGGPEPSYSLSLDRN